MAPNIGDQLITFEELPVGTVISNQFASRGVIFQSAGALQVTTNLSDRFVPVSPSGVYGDPTDRPAAAGELDLNFVANSAGEPAITDFVSFFLLNAQNQGATVAAFDTAGGVLYSNTFHAGGASQELVTISQPGIARVQISLGAGADHAAIDNLSYTSPRSGADLAAGVLSAPATALPGGTLSITWAVTNLGITEVHAPWSEQLFLAAAGSPNQTLAIITSSSNLAPGTVLVRTQDVTVPLTGLAGNLRVGVRVDLYDEVAELDEGNNLAFARDVTVIPEQLILDTDDPSTAEGGVPLTIRVLRNGDISQALTVALSNNNPAEVSVPTNILFNAGQASTAFTLQALTDGIVDGDKTVDLSATANGYNDGALSILVRDIDTPQLTLRFPSSSVVEGGSILGSVSLPVGSGSPLTVFIHSSLPGRTLLPDSIVLPAGASDISFQVATVDDGIAASPRQLVLTAEAAGYLSSNPQTLMLLDADLPPLGLILSRQIVSEGDGARATIVTVSRTTAGSADLSFELQASLSNVVQTPRSVVIPAGDLQASFAVGVVDDNVTNAPRNVLLQLFPVDPQTGQRISDGVSTNLVVIDNDGPTLSLALGKRLVGKGLSPATTGTVTRHGDLAAPLTVTLGVTDNSIATVPALVTLPAGQGNGTFPINTLDDSHPGTTKVANISASAPGFAGGSETLIVSDVLKPDLIVTNVSGPANAETESFVSITYRVANQGFASFSSNVLTRIFLSTNPGTGNDLFAGDFTFTGSIPPGEFFEQTLQVRLPTVPGDYWIIATTDLEDHVGEIFEDNNTGISATPVHVHEAYSATARTDANVVPAGTPVTFHGHAVKANSNVPAPQVPVNLHLLVRDTRRVLLAVTDDNGDFTITFTPLPNEAGNYSFAAAHPGDSDPASQGQFTIVGLRGRLPDSDTKLIEGSPLTLQIPLENLSDKALSGLQARVVSAPSNVSASPLLPADGTLPGSGATMLTLNLQARDASITSSNIIIRVTSAEGATTDLKLPISVESNSLRLVTNPPELLAGMKRGVTTTYDFDLINSGGAESGPITILTPAEVTWLKVATSTPLPSMAPGQSNRITLQFSPPTDLPLGDYQGAFILRTGDRNISIPFNFRALSEAKGDLRITAVDEYTYYADGAPPVTNATVIVRDAISGSVLTNAVTDANGQFSLPQIFEGYYDIQVMADQHIGYHDTSLVRAGITNDVQAFLSRETVRYIWTVVPTEIEDRTTISIETEFETFVPIPVITIEPAVIDLAQINADVTQIDLRISNHGLLAANDFTLGFSSHPDWQLEPLVSELGALPARSSLVVPLTIRRLKSIQPQSFKSLKGTSLHALSGPCSIVGGGQWDIICGTKKHYSAPIQILNAGAGCGGGGGGSWGGSGSAGAPYISGPTFSIKTDCSTNDCKEFDLPKIDLSGVLKPVATLVTTLANEYLAAQPWNFFLGLELEAKPEIKGQFGICCKDNNPQLKVSGEASGEVSVSSKKFNIEKTITTTTPDFEVAGQTGLLELTSKIFVGTKAVPSFKVSSSYTKDCKKDKPVYEATITGGVQIKSGIEGSVEGKFTVGGVSKTVTPGEVKGGLAGGLEFSLTINSEGEKKLCYKSDGLYLFQSANILGKTEELFDGGKYYLIKPQEDCSSLSGASLSDEAFRQVEAQISAAISAQQSRLSAFSTSDGGVCVQRRQWWWRRLCTRAAEAGSRPDPDSKCFQRDAGNSE